MTYVDKFYKMDPETDDVLPRGCHLRKGMKVLVGWPGVRENVDIALSRPARYRADKFNRWMTVDSIPEVLIRQKHTYILFIALYEDGTREPIQMLEHVPWFVKKDYIPYQSDDLLRLQGMKEGIRNSLDSILRKQKSLLRNYGGYTDERRTGIIEHALYEIVQNVERTINSLDEKDISKTYERSRIEG